MKLTTINSNTKLLDRSQLFVPITLPLGKEPLLPSKEENEWVIGPVRMWRWKDTRHVRMKSQLPNVPYVILLAEYPVWNQYTWSFEKKKHILLMSKEVYAITQPRTSFFKVSYYGYQGRFFMGASWTLNTGCNFFAPEQLLNSLSNWST